MYLNSQRPIMKVFGLTVLAKDTVGLHYINHTVAAMSLAEADDIVLKYYQMIQISSQ